MVEANPEQVSATSEQERVMALVAPLKADKAAWEATFTEEEKEAGNAFVEHLRANRES